MKIVSSAFKDGQPIPQKYAYVKGGKSISPALNWTDSPAGVKEFALIVDDPDAPFPDKPRKQGPWVHWIIYKIPAIAAGLKEGLGNAEKLSDPAGALQGKNDFGEIGYGGPMPPQGSPPHRYVFTIYALDAQLDLKPGLTKAKLLEAIKGHILAEGKLTGTYKQ